MRTIIFLVMLLLLPRPAAAVTVEQALTSAESQLSRVIVDAGPGKTWGERLALADLRSLATALLSLRQGLVAGSPTSLKPGLDELERCTSRVRTSRALLKLAPDSERRLNGCLSLCQEIGRRMWQLRDRFAGRDQPQGPALARAQLHPQGGSLLYQDPEQLWREARYVRGLVQEIRARFPYWGADLGVRGYADAQDIQRLLLASYHFEDACQDHYQQVDETRPAFERLRRAYHRAGLDFASGNDLTVWQLQHAMRRLSAFYASLHAGGSHGHRPKTRR